MVEADEQPKQTDTEISDEKPQSPRKNDVKEGSAPPSAETQQQQGHLAADSAEGLNEKPTSPMPDEPQNAPISAGPPTNGEPPNKAIDTQADGASGDNSSTLLQESANNEPSKEEQPQQDVPIPPPDGQARKAEPEKGPSPIATSTFDETSQEEPSTIQKELVVSEQDSLDGDEALEDLKKRKRRSTTPPLSSESVQKKVKIADATPRVKLPEDTSMTDADATEATDAPTVDTPQAPKPSKSEDTAVDDAPPIEETGANGKVETPIDPTQHGISQDHTAIAADKPPDEPKKDSRQQTPEQKAPTPAAESSTTPTQSPAKRSPPDARFKNILPASTRRSTPPPPSTDPLDRTVTPALHPATTALYIRNILRPLHIDHLRDHLLSLATPSSPNPDPSVITTFHLDSIRTHCLVRFSTVAAASRVRTGLHDRVWPDEKNRKPLWVDFVPEEKLDKWISVENEGSGGAGRGGGRGGSSKRWEVVYEQEGDAEDGGVKAYLQEVGSSSSSNTGGINRSAQRPIGGGGTGVRGAPSGPRQANGPAPAPAPVPTPTDKSRGFRALDDLFRSTTTKPKLYYLPTDKRTADRRLDLLAEGRGGGRGGDEMRRYTFEEGVLVDRGPEFGMRGRGGGRSGYGGGGRGGGGYRGEYYRRDRR